MWHTIYINFTDLNLMNTKTDGTRLLLMRHAKSDWVTGDGDPLRPLARRGVRDAVKMGKWFSDLRLPHIILCSTARRTTETLDFLEIGSGRNLISITKNINELYHCSFDSLREIIEGCDVQGDVMVIGHNPALEQLLLWLLEDTKFLHTYQKPFPTGAIYELRIEAGLAKLEKGSATVLNFMRPKLV